MKKVIKLSLLGLLAMPILAGCGKEPEPTYKEERTEVEIIDQLIKASVSEVGVEYAKFSAAGVAVGETALVMTVNQKVWEGDEFGMNFKFEYTLEEQEDYATDYLALNEGKDKLVAEIVDSAEIAAHPEYTIANSLNGAAYYLKAKVSFAGYAEGFVAPEGLVRAETAPEKTMNKQWAVLVKCTFNGSISEIKVNTDDGDMVITRGKVVAAYDWRKGGLYTGMVIADGNVGVLLYAGKISDLCFDSEGNALIKKGDYVEIYGLVSPYNGLYEVKPQTIKKLDPADADDAAKIGAVADPTFGSYTVPEINGGNIELTGNLAEVSGLKLVASDKEGKVTLAQELEKLSTGAHWTLNAVDADNNKIAIYVNYHIGAAAQTAIKTLLSGLSETDTFTFKGMISAYNKKQLTPLDFGDEGGAAVCFVKD